MKQGESEKTAGLRPIPSDDREWWTEMEEGYWRSLLEQGEVAPEVAFPCDPHEVFQGLGLEKEVGTSANPPVTAEEGGRETTDGWPAARQALDRGDLFSLRVSGANRGGLLVEWNGLQGFVPASQLKEMPCTTDADDRTAELARRIGDRLLVRLIEVDEEQNRLVFSERAAASGSSSPMAVLKTLKPGDVRPGIVTNLTTFGAFVDLGGIEGLIHLSELSWDRTRHPADLLSPGQELEVYVLGVNPEEQRIALSLKRLQSDPWSRIGAEIQPGQVVEGVVTNVVSFGAFVRVAEGVEGLIHVSELAEGSFLHPRNVVREGERVRVRVLNVDVSKRRLGLSLRQAYRP